MPQSSTLDGEAVAAANRWDTEAALVLRKLNSLVGVQLDGPAITPQKSAAPCERLLNIRCPAEEFRKQLLDDLERLEVVAWRLVPDREEEKLSPPPEGEDIFEVRLARTWFVDVTRREKSKVRPIHDYTFARWASDSPALTKDKFENGRVYHILGEVLAHPSFAPYRSIFERAYREGYRGAGETRTKAKLLGVSPRKRGGRTRAARDSGKL